MRTFYEEWTLLDNAPMQTGEDFNLAHACAKLPGNAISSFWNTLVPNSGSVSAELFFSIGFSHHRLTTEQAGRRYQSARPFETIRDFFLFSGIIARIKGVALASHCNRD